MFFIDGHSDFYQPLASTTGEVADIELSFLSGRGPDVLSNIEGLKPLVLDEDIVVFGYRDAEQSKSYGSNNVRNTNMQVLDLSAVRNLGIKKSRLSGSFKFSKEREFVWFLDSLRCRCIG